MQTSFYGKAGIMALLLTLGFVAGWEVYLRSQGFTISYDDGEPLWAYHRQHIYDATSSGPVIIGSSRIKFGIDLGTWEETTGKALYSFPW